MNENQNFRSIAKHLDLKIYGNINNISELGNESGFNARNNSFSSPLDFKNKKSKLPIKKPNKFLERIGKKERDLSMEQSGLRQKF